VKKVLLRKTVSDRSKIGVYDAKEESGRNF
jgi:hypothetical protein